MNIILEEIFSYSKEKIEDVLNLESNVLQTFIVYGEVENNYDIFRYKICVKYFEEDNLLLYDKLLMYYFEEGHGYVNITYYPTMLRHDNPIDTIMEMKERYNLEELKELVSDKIGFIIGCGSTGCIVKPALNTFDYSYISKVGFINGITNEYKNIKILPKTGIFSGEDSPFFDIDSVSFSQVDPIYHKALRRKLHLIRSVFEELEFYEKNFKDGLKDERYTKSRKSLEDVLGQKLQFNIYEITMPYVKGETLYNILRSEKTKSDSILKINDSFHNGLYQIVYIESNEVIQLVKSLCKLYYQIYELNNTYKIYHNDLHMKNIIYNKEDNKITVIDFDQLSLGLEKRLEGRMEDTESIATHIKIFLLCGSIDNDDFKEFLIDNEIITHFEISIDIFIDGFIDKLLDLQY